MPQVKEYYVDEGEVRLQLTQGARIRHMYADDAGLHVCIEEGVYIASTPALVQRDFIIVPSHVHIFVRSDRDYEYWASARCPVRQQTFHLFEIVRLNDSK